MRTLGLERVTRIRWWLLIRCYGEWVQSSCHILSWESPYYTILLMLGEPSPWPVLFVFHALFDNK